MDGFLETLGPDLMPLLTNLVMLVVTAIFTILGYQVNKLIKKYKDHEVVKEIRETLERNKEIVQISVDYAEQIGGHLLGPEKRELAKDKALEMANQKGFAINEAELDALIEQAVRSFKKGLTADTNKVVVVGQGKLNEDNGKSEVIEEV